MEFSSFSSTSWWTLRSARISIHCLSLTMILARLAWSTSFLMEHLWLSRRPAQGQWLSGMNTLPSGDWNSGCKIAKLRDTKQVSLWENIQIQVPNEITRSISQWKKNTEFPYIHEKKKFSTRDRRIAKKSLGISSEIWITDMRDTDIRKGRWGSFRTAVLPVEKRANFHTDLSIMRKGQAQMGWNAR